MVSRSWYKELKEAVKCLHRVGLDYMLNCGDPRTVLIITIVILFNAIPFIIFLIFAAISSAVILGSAMLALCTAVIVGTIVYLPVLFFCTVAGIVMSGFVLIVSCFFEAKLSRYNEFVPLEESQ